MMPRHKSEPYFPTAKAYMPIMVKTTRRGATTLDLFGEPDPVPAGFRYQSDFISEAEESELVAGFEALPFRPFEYFGHLGNRRVVSFGQRYDYGDGKLHTADSLPDWLDPLKHRAAAFADLESGALNQALVTEYTAGAGIGWHRDRPIYEDVIGISFLSACTMRLRHEETKGWSRQNIELAPRSVYLFRGEVRNDWEHSIAPMPALRYSVTFRSRRNSQ
jgi:alkylated DNA repair dioxygenase AlkB